MLVRSYSRMTGRTRCDSDTHRSGNSAASIAPMACSWAGLAYEWRRLTASESMPSATSASTARRASARSSGVTTAPSRSTRSADLAAEVALDERRRLLPGHVVQPRHPQPAELEDVAEAGRRQQPGPGALALEDRVGRDGAAVDDVADARSGRRRAGRGPSRTPSATPALKSSGVEGSLPVWIAPSGSVTTMSVNVPPTSTPTRTSWRSLCRALGHCSGVGRRHRRHHRRAAWQATWASGTCQDI